MGRPIMVSANCVRCGKQFQARATDRRRGRCQCCSLSCANARGTDTLDGLMSRVEFDTNGGCWLWTGSTRRHGYGAFRPRGQAAKSAHRAAYEYANGVSLTADQHICHKCDVPACINPAHLFVGTRADNMRDMAAKGRAGNQWQSSVGEPQPKDTK